MRVRAMRDNRYTVPESGVDIRKLLSTKKRSFNFDQIDLMEGETEFSLRETAVDVSGQFSKNIRLRAPFIAAPMPDCVDEHVATVMPRYGGLAIVPATYQAEEQAQIIKNVKKAENRFIEQPFFLSPDDTVGQALDAPYSNIPIVVMQGGKKVVVGMVSVFGPYGEYRFGDKRNRPVKEIMDDDLSRILVHAQDITVRGEFDFDRAAQMLKARDIPTRPLTALTIVGNDNELLRLVTIKDAAAIYPLATRDKKGRLSVGAAILNDMVDENKRRIRLLADAEVDVIVIEHAKAWKEDTKRMTLYLKEEYPHIDVVPGNDSVGRAVEFHYKNGADGVKVGQGPGSQCISGEVIGLWRPQLSAAFDCGNATHKFGVPCIADGGIRNAYHVLKAMAVGAHAVMLGKLIAQTSDSPAEEVQHGKKLYRAMGSPDLVKKYREAFYKYSRKTFIPEGGSEIVDITTSLIEFMEKFKANLERSFERFGFANLEDMHTKLRKGKILAQYAHDTSTK